VIGDSSLHRFVAGIAFTIWAVIRNLMDANRAKSIRTQVISLKEEWTLQAETAERNHVEELRKLEVSSKADIWRANEVCRQLESEKQEALARLTELERQSASVSRPSKLVIHSAFYGNSPEREESVIQRIRELPIDALAISVTNNVLGCDPAPNIPPRKRLRVRYSYGSDTFFETSREKGEILVLPDPTDRKRIIS